MNFFLLTSSRADYGIYLPLLRKLQAHKEFNLKLVVFGTHLSKLHGYTVKSIYQDCFDIVAEIKTVAIDDDAEDISRSIGKTIEKFASFWKEYVKEIDLIIALGDRYEMFGAVASSVPFNIPVAHLHGGETTLGAIDDKLRHSISVFSKYHFTSTREHAKNVAALKGSDKYVWNTGALSLDNMQDLQCLEIREFEQKFSINLDIPTILVTLHPETINPEKNLNHVQETVNALKAVLYRYQVVITMPNADTASKVIRNSFIEFGKIEKVILVENFGTQGYFTCMKHCIFLLGNTSSGIIEAASFGKYVINLGERQKGRQAGKNVIHVPFNSSKIVSAIRQIENNPKLNKSNIYYNGGASNKIIEIFESLYY